ncbi:MAG: ABC transporter ATP-binding protein/permease, partial [Beijerinckiaceae bacterium]
ARRAWILTFAVIALMLATLGINLALNYWNRAFFDALEKRSAAGLWSALYLLPAIIIAGAALAALTMRTRMTLQLRWREFVTADMLARWLGEQRYYRLGLAAHKLGNPEHRIAEDIRLATEPVVELATGLGWSASNAIAFLGILVVVGGSYTIGGITVPGYLALGALIYAGIILTATIIIGSPLTSRIADKNESEAQFRYEMIRVRENAESIAFLQGDEKEQANIREKLSAVAANWLHVIRAQSNLQWVLNAHTFLAGIVPALLAAPKYLNGDMTLGAVMQVVAAFVAVLGALTWLADNFIRLAEVRASAVRVEEMRIALAALDEAANDPKHASIAVNEGKRPAIELSNVTLRRSDGGALVKGVNLRIRQGQKVMIEGRSGSGKSTLLRALAGFWKWGAGDIHLPEAANVTFVPQKPYIPLGPLKDALTYPEPAASISDADAAAVLQKIGLPQLAERLDTSEEWDKVLSGGERQRLAFGRLLLQRPDIIVLDEATSALDDASQAQMFELLTEELPDATILNVAHRKGLEKYHDQKVVIDKSGNVRQVAAQKDGLSPDAPANDVTMPVQAFGNGMTASEKKMMALLRKLKLVK